MRKKILIAEDDRSILDVVTIVLADSGYEIFAAESSDDVLRVIATNSPDLILLDIWLAGEDGSKIAMHLKKDPKTQHIPIVMVSANTDTEKIAKGSGADGFLLKPFDIDELLLIAEKHIKKY